MPHAVFNLGTRVVDVDTGARHLIPGVVPGGQRAGQEMKPALLIRDCWVAPNRLSLAAGSTADINVVVSLKLSQETDLSPGLLLPLAFFNYVRVQTTGTDVEYANSYMMKDLFHAQGSIWAPRVVGVQVEHHGGQPLVFDVDVHLDYEQVDVPWMDWFVMWDFLDNVVDNDMEY